MKLERALGPLGTMAACFTAVAINVVSAQYYRRWDATHEARYSLSAATKKTLHDLSAPVEAWVLLSRADPLEAPIRQLLEAYRAESASLELHYVDPDREPVELVRVKERFGIQAAKIEDGRVLTDAVVVFAQGQRRWFVTANELYVREGAEGEVHAREERALTLGLRSFFSTEKRRLCFTEGHGEARLEGDGDTSLAPLRAMLEKENFELRPIRAAREGDPFSGCAAVVIADPKTPFSGDEDARLRTYLLTGGNLLLAVSPFSTESHGSALTSRGFDASLAPFGIELEPRLVVETDARRVTPDTAGLEFIAVPKVHAISETLVPSDKNPDPPRAIVARAGSLRRVGGEGNPIELLASSDTAIAKTSLDDTALGSAPHGPFPLAFASERPKLSSTDAHGPRVVVFGSGTVVAPYHFQAPIEDHGSAFLVENALSWITSRPDLVDIPERKAALGPLKWTEKTRLDVRNYVLVLMPLAVALLGAAILLFRRSNERSIRGEKA